MFPHLAVMVNTATDIHVQDLVETHVFISLGLFTFLNRVTKRILTTYMADIIFLLERAQA